MRRLLLRLKRRSMFLIMTNEDHLILFIYLLVSFLPYSAICSLARPWEALLIGAIGAMLACPGCKLLERLEIDDPVGCVPTHAFAGIWGLVAVAFFTEKDVLENTFSGEFGIFKGGPWKFLGVQLLMSLTMTAWAATSTYLELLLVNLLVGMRMNEEEELLGADKVEHGIEPFDANSSDWPDVLSGGENVVESRLESIGENPVNLQNAGSRDSLSEIENGQKDSLATICSRRKQVNT